MGLHSHTIDIQIASRIKGIPDERTFKRWLLAALPRPAELTLRVVNAAEGRGLNGKFRGKDTATNVLTFIYHELKSPLLMGDIVLCAPIVTFEARAQGKMLEAHYAHLAVHGVLHLSGMDHEDERSAMAMEKKEIAIVKAFGYSNPYANHEDQPTR